MYPYSFIAEENKHKSVEVPNSFSIYNLHSFQTRPRAGTDTKHIYKMNECIHIRLLNAPMRPAYWSRFQFSVKEQYWIPNIHVNALLENSKQEMIKL